MVLTYFLVLLCLMATCAGQPPSMFGGDSAGPTGCFMTCLKSFGESAGPLMTGSSESSPMNSQKIKIGNVTESCPAPMNKSDLIQVDRLCGSVKELLKCSDPCPDDMIKNISSIGFKPMKFMCVDKFEDIKKYLPCLSQTCPDIQRTCVPKCGSLDALTEKMKSLGGSGGDSSSPFATMFSGGGETPQSASSNDSAADNANSMNEIIRDFGDLCIAVDCHVNCSKAPILAKCGKEAAALSEDLLKMVVNTLEDISTALGFKEMIPDKCKPLMAHVQQTGSSTAAAASAPVAAISTTTTTASSALKNETASKMRQLEASTKCEKPPCKGSGLAAVPSMLLLTLVLAFVQISYYLN